MKNHNLIITNRFAGYFIKERSGVDDSLDALTVHGVGGLVGFLCTGIFCSIDVNPAGAQGLIYGTGDTLAKHIAIVLCLVPCLLLSTYGIFFVVDCIIPVRVTQAEEDIGLDKSMHSEEYSYHRKSIDDNLTNASSPDKPRVDPLDSSNHSTSSIDKHVKSLHSSGIISGAV